MEKQPRFTIILKRPEALRAMFLSPSELKLGEAYIYQIRSSFRTGIASLSQSGDLTAFRT